MIYSIKTKIITILCLIVAFSLVVSGGVAYYYCFNLLQTQFINDEILNLNKTTRQIEYITEDIHKFALNIALDNDVQAYLRRDFPLGYEKFSQIHRTQDKISALEVQRNYMFGIVLVKENEMILSKSHNKDGLDETNYKEIMRQSWYTDISAKEGNSVFTNSYDIVLPQETTKVMAYVVNVRDITSPGRRIGQLILNINYEYFKQFMVSDSTESDNYFWIDSRNHFLYQKDSGEKEISRNEVVRYVNRTETGVTNSYQTENGYLIIDRTMRNGWVYVSYIMKDRIWEKERNLLYFFFIYTLIILVFASILILPIVSGITRPLSKLTKVMKQVSRGDMDVTIEVKSKDELAVLGEGFNKMLYSLKGYIRKTVEYEKERRNIELSLLMAQINPHFIYNTLHTVIYMASKTKNNDIADMVRSFIAVLQDNVKINEEGLITTLRDELDTVRQYSNIQQYRYNNRFSILWEIDEQILDCKIPRTILQPLVENSLLHGILQGGRVGVIFIKTEASGEDLLITIEDNGVGMEQDAIEKIMCSKTEEMNGRMRSIGMSNVLKRIKYICGEKYGFRIQSEANRYTRIIIQLPRDL